MIETGKRFAVLAALLVAAPAGPAAAADIAISTAADKPSAITLAGAIVKGDAAKFRKLLTPGPNEKPVTALLLSSSGGAVAEAAEIATLVRNANIATRVANGATCASACFLIFAAGKHKFAGSRARIGVHSANDMVTGAETDAGAHATVSMGRVLQSYGVPERIIGRMVLTAPTSIAWLSTDDLRSMGVQMDGQAPAAMPADQEASNYAAYMAKLAQPPSTTVETPGSPRATPWPKPTLTPEIIPTSRTAPPAKSATSPVIPLGAQRVVFYEEDPTDALGRRFAGSVIWRSEMTSAAGAKDKVLTARADVEIPERRITMQMSFRRNSDPALPASHTIEIAFHVPADFPNGGISNVPGLLMKQAEQTRGSPLAGLAVKVTSDVFLVGLSAVDAEMQRNLQLLRERAWFDIPIVYHNGRRAIVAIEKGGPGDQVLSELLAASGNGNAAADGAPDSNPEHKAAAGDR
jgi:hypothetical protein